MRWLTALLLIVNVAVFLWFSGRHGGEPGPNDVARPDINQAGMLLLTEAGPDQADRRAVSADRLSAQGDESADRLDAAGEGDRLPAAGPSCYRIGPFKQQDTWQLENEWMKSQNIDFVSVTSDSRQLRAVRVYLGLYSRAVAETVVQRLKQVGLEYFLYEAEPGKIRISLGYFTQEALAKKFVDHVLAQGFDARLQHEYYILGPYSWMEVAVDSERRRLILERSWAEQAVAALKMSCAPA